MAQRIPLTHLSAALIEAGYSDAPNYRALYEAARSARIPAKPNKGGRWTFCTDDLPQIADALGLGDAIAA